MHPISRFEEVIEKEYFPGFKGRMIHTHHMTFALWKIEAGSILPLHHHPHEQVVQMIEGEFEMILDDQKIKLQSGDILIIPPNAPHEGKAMRACKVMDIFSPRRQDYMD